MRKACNVVSRRAKELCPGPGYPGDKKDLKPLRDTIGSVVKSYGPDVTVGIVGPQYPAGAHGHLIEGGTKPHTIREKPQTPGTTMVMEVDGDAVFLGPKIEHPGTKPNPFMASASAETRDAQQAAIIGSINAATEEIMRASQ